MSVLRRPDMKTSRRRATAPGGFFVRALLLALALATVAPSRGHAADCPNPNALGTSRVIEIDTRHGRFFGTKSYPETLPLGDHEIVLTFDDGPAGKTTDAVLEALHKECVKATFFIVGDMAKAHPEQLKRIAAEGHTIGHHSMTHVIMTTVPFARAKDDIAGGWRTVDRILYGEAHDRPRTPFFRFPGFAPTKETAAWLSDLDVGVFGADFWGSDWMPMTAQQLLDQVLLRIEVRRSGILLLHDIHAHTAAMVPELLRELHRRGWKVVHMVSKGGA